MVLLCPFANVELAFLELFYGHVSERELADRLEVGIYIKPSEQDTHKAQNSEPQSRYKLLSVPLVVLLLARMPP